MRKKSDNIYCILILLSLLFNSQKSHSQVNTEKMRQWADSSGLSGNFYLSTKLINGNSELFQGDAKVNFLYRHEKHLLFSLNNFSQTKSKDNKFIDKGFSLLRYNYEFTPKYITEFFLQGEFNHIRKLEHRYLAGLAFRYVPIHREKIYGALGIAAMREEEAISDTTLIKYRSSLYATFKLKINEILSLNNTVYYQPRISNPKDFRLLNEGFLELKVWKQLEFFMSIQYRFDSEPPALVKHYDIELKNGIKFNF